MNLKNATALVTGGSSGIGFSIAKMLIDSGARVVITGRDERKLAEASRGLGVHGIRADVSNEADVQRTMAETIKHLGGLDILINNAGITGPTLPTHEMPIRDFDRTLAINLRTPFVLSRAVIPSMIERRSGTILNISSIAGKMAYPLRTPYASSKWGVIGLALTMAQELGPHNIRVNAICPGPTRTEMIDSVIRARAAAAGVDFATMAQEYTRATALKRMVLPEEVADLVLFLCSPAAEAITGQAIDVSAGYGFRIGN